MTLTISRTELARNTREVLEQVRKGSPVVVESYGEEQVILLDAMDYRLMRSLVNYAVTKIAPNNQEAGEDAVYSIMHSYLEADISLAKAAEEVGMSRFELMERFERLGVPLRIGVSTVQEARDEIAAAHRSIE